MARYKEYKHLLDDGKTVYDEKGNRHEVYENDQLLGGGKNIYIDGKKYQTYDHLLDDGKTLVRPDGSSIDVYSSDHLLDDGKTVYAGGNTYDVYSGKNIFGESYTQVNQRGGYSAGSGGYGGGYTGGDGGGYAGGYDAYTSPPPSGFYHGPISVPKENVSLAVEFLVLLLLPCLSVLTGFLTREGGLIIFAVFLLTWSGMVLGGLRGTFTDLLPALGTAVILGKFTCVHAALQTTSYASPHPLLGTLAVLGLALVLGLFVTDETEELIPGFFLGAVYAGVLWGTASVSGHISRNIRLVANLIMEGGLLICLVLGTASCLIREHKNMGGNKFDRFQALKLLGAGCLPPLLADIIYQVTGKAVPRLVTAAVLLLSYLIIGLALQKRSYYEAKYRFWILVPLALLLAFAMIARLPADAIPDKLIHSDFLRFMAESPVVGFLTKGLIRCSTGVGNLAEASLDPLVKGRYPDIPNTYYGIWLYAAARLICSLTLKCRK
jgi:hypothetical protein